MRRTFFAALFLAAALGRAQEPAPANPSLDDAEQAMAAKLPEVAIVKLNVFLTSSAALDDSLRERAERDLTRAMLDSGDVVGALARLEYPSGMSERFWKAEALSSLGRWDDAIPLYAEVAADGPDNLREAATIGQAEALHAVSRDLEARSLLETLEAKSPSTLLQLRLAELDIENQDLDSARALLVRSKPANLLETRWREYVEGRIYLAEDQDAPALEDFQDLLNSPNGLTAALQAGATVGLTEARIALNGREAADDVIEAFITQHPESPYLDEMFRRLDIIYSGEENPSESELQRWAAEAPPRRAALALYYQGRSLQRQVRQEKAIRAYTDFIHRFPDHPFAFDAWMQLGELYLDTSRLSNAGDSFEGAMRVSADPTQRARAEIAAGNADFAQGDFLHAAETFHDAADRSPDPNLWLEATYDSALAWLHVGNGNYDRFLGDYNALSQRFPESDQRRDLLLEEGLLQARSGDPRAASTLQSFVHDFPDNRRIAEAQLALAELGFAAGDMDSANHLLQAAYVSSPTGQSREQADYLAIFIADSAKDRRDDQVLRLAQQFLDDWPSSTLRAQVRMKMGELYFRNEDFADAETQFENLVEESPNDPLVDKALILAGESSVSAMTGDTQHALSLFEQVANGSGPLKLYARQEEALLNARTGNNKGAVIIYDDILRSNPDTDLRLAALCGKADCLIAAASDSSPTPSPTPAASPAPAPAADPFATAIALYDQVANDPDATPPWRNQALYKKGRCLAKEGFNDQALAAYYDVLNSRAGAGQQQPDFFWFEKAGFDAAAMLEAKSQWPGAISILEKVAQAAGPRGPEAKKAAEQLRLEHFVWD
jgi:TolA-binding protein